MPEAPLSPIEHDWFDSSGAPLYLWTLRSDPTSVELAATLRARERWAQKTQAKVAWVVDLTHLGAVPAMQRKLFAAHLERFRAFDQKWTVASAIVAPSAWLQGLVTAVFWLTPPKFAHKVFDNLATARDWAQAELDRLETPSPRP
jgi:hypothetical protein